MYTKKKCVTVPTYLDTLRTCCFALALVEETRLQEGQYTHSSYNVCK